MFENPLFLLGTSIIFAAIPIVVWFYFLFKKSEKSKKIVFLIFFLGCLTAPALLGIQYLWDIFPKFNLAAFIEANISTQNVMYIAMFVLFGAMEEIIKLYVITVVDKKTVLIKTIDDAIKYSIVSALGFSFVENVYYLFQFWPSVSTGQLAGMYIFRSLFTTCAHMIFSGVFGYFYGVGKYSIDLTQEAKLEGKKSRIATIIGKVFNLSLSRAYQQQMVIRGLLTAILLHASYNYLLQFNRILPAMIFVILGYSYLRYLLNRKAGHLILATDISSKKKSTLAKKDEDVVIELLGMWFNEKKYVDVIHICERLLGRDPDNNVVKLFKAKAMDRLDDKDTYKKILGNMLKGKEELDANQKNKLTNYIEQKEKLQKEHGNTNAVEQPVNDNQETPTTSPKSPVEKYTGEGTFKINS